MEPEPTETPTYMPASSPSWAGYYRRAKETRRLGKGQYAHLQRETKQRRRHANLMILVSTVALAAVVAACYALLGASASPSPEGGVLASPHARRA
jgi:hypothetical protein